MARTNSATASNSTKGATKRPANKPQTPVERPERRRAGSVPSTAQAPQASPRAPAKPPTLREIADNLLGTRWRDARRYENNRSQVKACLEELRLVKWAQGVRRELSLADISQDDLRAAVEPWRFRDRLVGGYITEEQRRWL